MSEHRWSGWPGAWCLDCGAADAREECLAEYHRDEKHQIPDEMLGHICMNDPCPEPGSKKHDPYV